MNLYIDDSGTRTPDRKPGQTPVPPRDWFALGGVMLRASDEGPVREKHVALRKKWSLTCPLHSSEIRTKTGNFRWLRDRTEEQVADFMADLADLATQPQLIATACVVDRPGYNGRYREKYGLQRWSLCKTAFAIVVERALKFANKDGLKLRVLVEKSDPKTDKIIANYYKTLRSAGHPFDPTRSSQYVPLEANHFQDGLYELRMKSKTSPLMQIADLCLWPICVGGYDASARAYVALQQAGTLVDSRLAPEEIAQLGIKYSCWELVNPEKTDARS